jgi:tripartite-type tricarboxylate transporter receptor subunit TctC
MTMKHEWDGRRRALLLGGAAVCALSVASARVSAQAAAYPAKPIRLLVGYAPGGSADVSARILADALRPALGQSIVVENQPGAAGNIAAQTVARATPDGHTLLLGNTGEISINRFLMKDTGFDPHQDLVPIAVAYNITHAISVPANSRYRTFDDLIVDARSRANKVRYASAGIGTPGHLAGETLALKTRTTMVHIPYKGGGQVLADLLGGELECHIAALSTAMAHVKSGALRVLAVTSAKRVPLLPDVPTVAESGVAGFDFPLWGGLFAPAKTPSDVVTLLNREVLRAYDRPEVQARIRGLYSEIVKWTPEQFAAFVKADAERYLAAIKEAGIARN